VVYGYLLYTAEKKQRLRIFLEIWMLVIPVLLFFAVHSVLYWKALYGSMGLIRVVTGVLPLAAVISVKAYEYIDKTLFIKEIRNVFLFLVIILIIISNFSIHRYPIQLGPEEQAWKEAINWIKQTPLIKHKILFTDIDVPFLLDMDPWDHTKCEQKYTSKWLNCYPENIVFIWDSYYGTKECNVPLDILENKGEYRLVNIFQPKLWLNSWYERPYEICVFIKVPYGSHIDNKAIRDSIMAKNREAWKVRFIAGDNFEKNPKKKVDSHVSGEVARSGSLSYKVISWEGFPSIYKIDISKIISERENVTIRVSCFVYPLIPFKENDTRLVITLKDRNEFYHSLPLDSIVTRINQWNKVSFMATFPVIKSSDRLVVYFWHLGKKEFYFDDLKIERVIP
jgi:hypothetical protein